MADPPAVGVREHAPPADPPGEHPFAPVVGTVPDRVARLLADMERMPAQPSLAMRVLWMCNDPSVDARRVADTVELDPVLTARVLRLANSPYYSLRATVANAHRAVVMLGCSTVAAVAASAVAASAGLEDVSPQFWSHSTAVAVACQLVAESFGVSSSDAFAVGLLHDLGAGVLSMSDPVSWRELELYGPERRRAAEEELFGIGHAAAGAVILGAWRVPGEVLTGIAGHHDEVGPASPPVVRLVAAGEALAALAFPGHGWETATAVDETLERCGMPKVRAARLVGRVREEASKLDAVFS